MGENKRGKQMKCLTYAVSEFFRGKKKYISMRWAKMGKPMVHFLVSDGLVNCEHMTQDKPDKSRVRSIFNILLCRNYKHKRGDK